MLKMIPKSFWDEAGVRIVGQVVMQILMKSFIYSSNIPRAHFLEIQMRSY